MNNHKSKREYARPRQEGAAGPCLNIKALFNPYFLLMSLNLLLELEFFDYLDDVRKREFIKVVVVKYY
jgi:hypothetical protein